MASSVLLDIVKDSILEVYQAKRRIDKEKLIKEYPILLEKITSTIKIFLNDELRGLYSSKNKNILLEDIIYNAKKAAFESEKFEPLKATEYIDCEIELILHTEDGDISHKEKAYNP